MLTCSKWCGGDHNHFLTAVLSDGVKNAIKFISASYNIDGMDCDSSVDIVIYFCRYVPWGVATIVFVQVT